MTWGTDDWEEWVSYWHTRSPEFPPFTCAWCGTSATTEDFEVVEETHTRLQGHLCPWCNGVTWPPREREETVLLWVVKYEPSEAEWEEEKQAIVESGVLNGYDSMEDYLVGLSPSYIDKDMELVSTDYPIEEAWTWGTERACCDWIKQNQHEFEGQLIPIQVHKHTGAYIEEDREVEHIRHLYGDMAAETYHALRGNR